MYYVLIKIVHLFQKYSTAVVGTFLIITFSKLFQFFYARRYKNLNTNYSNRTYDESCIIGVRRFDSILRFFLPIIRAQSSLCYLSYRYPNTPQHSVTRIFFLLLRRPNWSELNRKWSTIEFLLQFPYPLIYLSATLIEHNFRTNNVIRSKYYLLRSLVNDSPFYLIYNANN